MASSMADKLRVGASLPGPIDLGSDTSDAATSLT